MTIRSDHLTDAGGIAVERIGEALVHGAKASAGYLANAAQKDNGG